MHQPPLEPWFTADESSAARDFWRVYDDRFDDVEGSDARRLREALRGGFEAGDWSACEDLLAERGAQCGRVGLDPHEVFSRDLVRVLTPQLVRAHAESPDRLCAALLAMDAYVARRSSLLSTACARARDRTARSVAITLESIGDGVIATDENGRIERMNPVASELTKWSVDDAIGRPFEEVFRVFDEDRGEVVASRIDEVLTCGIVVGLPSHAAILARDDTLRPIADSLAPIVDPAGSIHGAVLVFRDLTHERERERLIEEHERSMAESHRQLRSLAHWVESSREEERTRIARELHDELAQQLTAIRMDIGWLMPRAGSPEVVERLDAMSGLVESIFAMVRRIGTELRPGILDDLGLAEAIEWQATEFERRSGIEVDVDTPQELGALADAQSTALFRMFQEILTNVARHAGAKRVVGRLVVDPDQVTLEVSDDGRSIRPDEIANPKSLGLLGMRERAALHGGTFLIRAGRGGGTVVSVTLPRHDGEQEASS